MSREGAYLGSVRDLATLRERCVIDAETECWHLRSARGRSLANRGPKQPLKVFVHGRGQCSARRVAWQFAHPEFELTAMFRIVDTCGSDDCVNPVHTVRLTTAQVGKKMRKEGRAATPAKRAAALRNTRSRVTTILTEELAQWARESHQTQTAVAHALGCRQQAVSEIRAGRSWRRAEIVGSSVFAIGAAMNSGAMRRAA